MKRIGPPDSHYLNAALGWLGLGLREDATAELNLISPEHQEHPDVLETRWSIHAGECQWDAALEAVRKLLLRAPDRAVGWLHYAYALRRAPEVSSGNRVNNHVNNSRV
jgi:predicted Zn-dependent protease